MTTKGKSKSKTGLKQLSSDLVKLYTSGAGANVTFVFPDGELKAHKNILCTRVDYFETMFAAGMKESLTNRVDISGTNKECYDVFLRYIYSGRLPDVFDVESQLNLAKMYDVPALITDCIPMLEKILAELPDVDCCVNEARRMIATYEIEAIKNLFEKELLNRIYAVVSHVSQVNPPTETPQRGMVHHTKCYYCRLKDEEMSKLSSVPVSFIDNLVTLLIFSHAEKCVNLKEKCLQHFAWADPVEQFKPRIAEATKKLAEYPDLLVEMVLHYRTGKAQKQRNN